MVDVGVRRQSRSPPIIAMLSSFQCGSSPAKPQAPQLHCWVSVGVRRSEPQPSLHCQFLQVSIGGSLIQRGSSQAKPQPRPNTVSSLLGQCGSSQVRTAALLALPVSASQHWRLADSAWEFAGKAAAPPQHCIFVVGSVWEFAGKSRSPPCTACFRRSALEARWQSRSPSNAALVFFCPITSCRVAEIRSSCRVDGHKL